MHHFVLKPFCTVFRAVAMGFLLVGPVSICAAHQFPDSLHRNDKGNEFDWLQTARVFLLDAYQPPFAPVLEYDAGAYAETMADMNANVLRFGTMGKYATIPGIRFTTHPDQKGRDLLQETIDACKPRGIKVVAYISTGHKLAWSMVTEDYPEYGQKSTPNGKPVRSHMFVGEDHGTVCWMTPYRQAFLDYVKHVVCDYEIDGAYFDSWVPHHFWPGRQLCYCDGCRNGFREARGLEIPYHENDEYTPGELKAIDQYHDWYWEVYRKEVVTKVYELVKACKPVPLISNIVNPRRMALQDSVVLSKMDGFLYERGASMLERAEGVGVPRSVGLHVWPYIGVYHNWPRLAFQGVNYQQEIYTNLMYGGGSIIAQPTGYVTDTENKKYISEPFGLIKKHEAVLKGMENYPYVGVVFGYDSPPEHARKGGILGGEGNARTAARGAFAACLNEHVQVSSISEFVLDDPEKLRKYPVLYLASVPVLSEKRVRNIMEYVRNGGCLIATHATSLFDKAGKRQLQFGLEELLKVKPVLPKGELAGIINSYQAMVGGPNDLYLLASETGSKAVGAEWKDKLVPLWYYEPVEVLKGGEVLADIVTGDGRRPVLPGVVMSSYGKGRVIYSASDLESLYDTQGPDVVGRLIRKLVEIASVKQDPPFTLEAPAGLRANLSEKDNLLLLHLTNWTGNKYEKPWWNEYYLSPVENVRLQIRIPDGKKIKRVSALVDGSFEKKITGRQLEIFFPRIASYQGVMVELE